MPAPAQTIGGVGNQSSVVPPDTEADVGPSDIVQWVNLSFEIWDKHGNHLYGPAAGNTLWSGFGGLCQSTNQGDPVVLYDRLADRWLFSQFAFALKGPNPTGPYYQCLAVSTSGDPTGSYYRYSFLISNSCLDDYPKFGVWPDAYYMSANMFCGRSLSFSGAAVFAFQRSQMLTGQPATMVPFQLNTSYFSLLPSNLNGPVAPPAGSPNYFAAVDTSSPGGTGSTLQLWKFHVDFGNTANSTFTGPTNLAVAPYNFDLCNFSQNCIPQPGTSVGLDPLADRLMYRLQYRNFGGYESLVVDHTVNIGSNQAGIRWYEVRNPGGTPVVYQQGTFAPDAVNRWMGSVAQDSMGDMALGFSASDSNSVFPSIRYVGRLAGDPLGVLPQGETTMVVGAGSQTGASRWGDYSTMSVDPSDGCTFWYTNEFYSATSSIGWATEIGSFRFPGCPGGWVGATGSSGYGLGGWNGGTDLTYFPHATLALDQGSRCVWSASTGDVRALQSPDQATREAACWYNWNSLQLHLTFSSTYNGPLELYAIDWDSTARRQTIAVSDGTSSQTAYVTSDFSQGAWLSFPITVLANGTVSITVTHTAGANAVLSGVFLGGAGSPYSSAPQGNWISATGSSGYGLGGWNGGSDLTYFPHATLALDQGSRCVWSSSTGDVRALQSPDQATREAACWYNWNSLQLHLAFSSTYTGQLELYALDWDSSSRRQTIAVSDGTRSQTAYVTSDFSQGAWLSFPITVPANGTVTITVTRTAGANAVLSGVFLVDAGAPYGSAPQGNWVGHFGSSGYALGGWNGGSDLTNFPNATLALDSGSRCAWSSATSDVRALENPDQTAREATCWYNWSSLQLHLTFSSTYTGQLELYAIDWDTAGRRQTITVSDGATSQTAYLTSDFSQGAWVSFPINVAANGTATITVTRTAGANAVLSGIFLG